jgi:hypothetical protein
MLQADGLVPPVDPDSAQKSENLDDMMVALAIGKFTISEADVQLINRMAFCSAPLPQASRQMLHLLRTQSQFTNIIF